MTDAPDLLPCAHCSGPARAREKPNSYGMGWVIQCDACGVHTITFKDCADAVAVWNRRASPPADADDDALLDHIAFLWRTYALEDDAKLTDAAVRLKRQLIGACSPRAQPAGGGMNAQFCPRCGAIVTLVLPSQHLTITCECGQQIGDWQRRAIEAEAEVEKLREAILYVLDDDESQPGGWGPDVTMQAVLREALSEGRKREALSEGRKGEAP